MAKAHKTSGKDWMKQAVSLIQSARQQAVRQTNSLMVFTYFHLGSLIVEQEQRGKAKAKYGDQLIQQLSEVLCREFGDGFSPRNLASIRLFYLTFRDKYDASILQTLSAKSLEQQISQTASAKFSQSEKSEMPSQMPFAERFPLSWSHYVTLLRVKNPDERSFYEIEAAQGNWSVRELKRQMDSGLFERLALSKDRSKVKELATKGQIIDQPEDIIKSPYILEFLGLEEKVAYSESDLETAIINKIEHFLLEMGKGFLFGGRQVRFSLDAEDFYVDLVLYNRLLQCFVLVDLKIGKLKHQDIGQMQMYVNYYDRFVKQTFEKPTVGIIICKDKSEAVVEITLPTDNKTIFANEYKLYLPSKAELKALIK
jgi:predicted nuclease of restriction endonuclease-like (RecB) superfamily